jgi:hypothetical protein
MSSRALMTSSSTAAAVARCASSMYRRTLLVQYITYEYAVLCVFCLLVAGSMCTRHSRALCRALCA